MKRCKCKKSECKQLVLTPPKAILEKIREFSFNKEKYGIAIDACLVDEISFLWDLGVVTTTCCCGHNVRKFPPHIGVAPQFIDDMRALGYKQYYNPCLPKQRNFFYPKSIKYTLFDRIRNFLWRIKCVFLSLTQ